MNIQLLKIDKENWQTCVQLEVAEEQKGFLPSNAYSLAESRFLENMTTLGIYSDETMVGFFAYVLDEEGDMNLTRFMIDRNHQNQGYGKKALHEVLQHIKSHYDLEAIWLSIYPKNHAAIKLYEAAGFEITTVGFETETEIFMKLTVQHASQP